MPYLNLLLGVGFLEETLGADVRAWLSFLLGHRHLCDSTTMAGGNMARSTLHHDLVLTLRILLASPTLWLYCWLSESTHMHPQLLPAWLDKPNRFFFYLGFKATHAHTLGKNHNQLCLHLQSCLSHFCFWPSLFYLLLPHTLTLGSAHLTKPFVLHWEKMLLYVNFFSFYSLKQCMLVDHDSWSSSSVTL